MPILIFAFLVILILANSRNDDPEPTGYSEQDMAEQANRSYLQGRRDMQATLENNRLHGTYDNENN